MVFGGTYLREVANAGWVMGCGAQTIREYKLGQLEDVIEAVDDSIVNPGVDARESDHLTHYTSD